MKRDAVRFEGKERRRTAAWLWVLIVVLAATVSGCSKRFQNLPAFWPMPVKDVENQSVGRFKTTYLADQIHAYYRGNTAMPLAVTTFVELDNVYQSSTFGRILGEQLLSELAMRGYNVLELRLSDSMQIVEDEGELGLSRKIEALRRHHDVAAIVVGTYAASEDRIYINARLVDPATSVVVSVGTVEMAKTAEIERLLRRNSFRPSLERIPVKQLTRPAVEFQFGPGQMQTPPAVALPDPAPRLPQPKRETLHPSVEQLS